MMLISCSSQPIIQTKTEYIYPSDTLFVKPCDVVKIKDKATVRDLSLAYVHNTNCAITLQNQVDSISEDINNKKKLNK